MKTLFKWLRRYWQAGRRRDGLLPAFDQRGEDPASITSEIKAARKPPGRKLKNGCRPYQMPHKERQWLERIAKKGIKKHGSRMALYEALIKKKWTTIDIRPVPIDVWRSNVDTALGMMTRLELNDVYWSLMYRDYASVTNQGIRLHGLFYTCQEIEDLEWLVEGGIKRFRVQVRYDRRRTDNIYVVHPDDTTKFFVAHLTPKSEDYRGLSLAEALFLLHYSKAPTEEAERSNLELKMKYDREASERREAARIATKTEVAIGKRKRESRTSGRPEIRGSEASKDATSVAEKRHAHLTGVPARPAERPTASPAESVPGKPVRSRRSKTTSMNQYVVIEAPLKALRALAK